MNPDVLFVDCNLISCVTCDWVKSLSVDFITDAYPLVFAGAGEPVGFGVGEDVSVEVGVGEDDGVDETA